jgi:hypothetical protein
MERGSARGRPSADCRPTVTTFPREFSRTSDGGFRHSRIPESAIAHSFEEFDNSGGGKPYLLEAALDLLFARGTVKNLDPSSTSDCVLLDSEESLLIQRGWQCGMVALAPSWF